MKSQTIKFFRPRSISTNLYLLVMLAVMPALAIILYSGWEQRRHSIDDARHDVLLLTHAMAETQQEFTRSVKQMLSTLSLLPQIQNLDRPACRDIFRTVLEQHSSYINIALTDINGDVLASGKTITVTNLGDRKHVRGVQKRKVFSIGEFIISRVGDATPAFAFAYPVLDGNNSLKAVLTTAVKLPLLSDFHDISNLPERSFVAVTDHKGIRLFYYPSKKDTNPIGKPISADSWEKAHGAKEPGIFIGRGSDGYRRIFAYEPVHYVSGESPYLYVWTGTPEAHVLAPANAALIRNTLFLIIATVLSLFISWVIGKNTLVSPIKNLVELTRKFAQGNLDVRSDLTTKPDELGALTKAFHDMAQTLVINQQTLRESEEKLARSRKMESLGLLAGGVAHDLNNVLSGIISYPELILLDLPENSELRKPVQSILDSGNRAAAIVQDLLTVARGVAVFKQPLNLNELVTDYLNSPEFEDLKQANPSILVSTNLDDNLFNLNGSLVHIRKVLMNMVLNAFEAVESNGEIGISTTNRYVDQPLKGYDDVSIGEYVVLSICDNGSGISPDDIDRIFEPFYTKKYMGRSGTGLGLAVVWNIIQDHKGYIDVITDGAGTTFELYFPMTREELSVVDQSLRLEDFRGNGESILIVDDVESQRDISCKMLDMLGYETKAVASGEEAIVYMRNNQAHLILLDMIMDPGISGRETYERILTIHPKQKAIIVSGFAVTEDVVATQKLGAGKYLKKPYTLEEIGKAVRDELAK